MSMLALSRLILAGRSLELSAPRPGPVFRHRTGSGPGGLGGRVLSGEGSPKVAAFKLSIEDFARGAESWQV